MNALENCLFESFELELLLPSAFTLTAVAFLNKNCLSNIVGFLFI